MNFKKIIEQNVSRLAKSKLTKIKHYTAHTHNLLQYLRVLVHVYSLRTQQLTATTWRSKHLRLDGYSRAHTLYILTLLAASKDVTNFASSSFDNSMLSIFLWPS